MNDIHGKKEGKSTNTVSPLVAGVAGVVAGGVAAAAAFVLSDKKNQKKAKTALVGIKERIKGYIDTTTAQPIIKKSAEKLEGVVRGTKKKIENKT